MKKILFLLVMLLLNPVYSYSQDKDEKRVQKLKKEITKKVDRFEDEITYFSSFKRSNLLWCKLFNKETNGAILLRFKTIGNTLSVGERGVYVLFEDGTKWSKDWEVNVKDADGHWWSYDSLVLLDYDEVEMFARKRISAFKLYIYENNVGEKEANDIMLLARIFKDLKPEAEQ